MIQQVDITDTILGMLSTNLWIIKRQTNGLTHEDSLLQLPFRGNCLNWVLGHIIEGRDRMLKLIGETPLLTDEQTTWYVRDSQPVINGDYALRLETLLGYIQTMQDTLTERLATIPKDDLLATPRDSEESVLEKLHGLAWHETYHVGQTEILRQLAGTNDKVI